MPLARPLAGRRSERIALAAILIVLAGVCGGLFSVVYQDARLAAIGQLHERQRIHARQAASGIQEYFDNWTAILSSLARIEDVIAVTPSGRNDLDVFSEGHRGQILSVTRMSETGVILYTAPHEASIGSDLSGQEHVRKVLARREPVISDVFRSVQGQDGVALHVPVFRGLEFRGTLAIVIDFENLARRYLEVIRVGTSGYAWVISENGKILYSPVPGFSGRPVVDVFAASPSILATARAMQRGVQGVATYTFDREGSPEVAPLKEHAVYWPIRLAGTYWSIAVASSEEEVLESLASFRNRLVLVMLALLLGGLALSMMGAKAWYLSREKETLARKVRERTAELEAANATLAELDRLKSIFIASMSHELRTPLTSIIGFTGVLLQGLAGPLNAEQQKQLGLVKGSARHLLDLITDIIDLSKIEAGKMSLAVESFDLVQITREVLDQFRIQAGQKSLELSLEAPQRVMLEADARRVRQVLINLVGNAVKFTDAGSVSVAVTNGDGTVAVSVRDTGPGIRPEDMGKLFRQFSQVGTAQSQKHEGTGLGLYLSRKLATLMGGDIRAESDVGRGSVFTATLPVRRGKETW